MIRRVVSAVLTAAVVAAGLVATGPPAAAAGGGAPASVPAGGAATGFASMAFAAAAASVSVRTGAGPLNVRSNTSTWHAPVGRLADGARVTVRCQLGGERIAGRVRTTAMWLQIGDQRYVSEAYLAWRAPRAKLPWCDQPASAAPRTRTAFISWAATHARASRSRYKVPVSVAVAQAINESGWGRSSLTTQGNAYFGIKCFGTPGPVAAGCRPYHTHECDNDDCFATTGTFRVYRTAARSFLDHGRFLRVNPRYQPAFRHTASPNRFAREIHKAGYATDPRYSDKLITLMRTYNLYRFDR